LSAVHTFGWAVILFRLGRRTLRTGRRPAYGALWLLIGEACVLGLTLTQQRLERWVLGPVLWTAPSDGPGHWLATNCVTTPLSLVVAWCWFRHGRRWEAARGDVPLCTFCGYNLTGNVSGRCPECGASIEAGGPAERSTGQP
jgi:hypothetical protein